MTDIIDFEVQKEKSKTKQERNSLISETLVNLRFENVFSVFGSISRFGNKRQREFLYDILVRFYFNREPIAIEEITEMMISYIEENKRYLKEEYGEGAEINYDKPPNYETLVRRMDQLNNKHTPWRTKKLESPLAHYLVAVRRREIDG